jgi:hypothetical protein
MEYLFHAVVSHPKIWYGVNLHAQISFDGEDDIVLTVDADGGHEFLRQILPQFDIEDAATRILAAEGFIVVTSFASSQDVSGLEV